MHPFISILIPVYNTERYLSQCLDSILSQSFSNIQVVLLDDGSSDNSYRLCVDYANRDHRVEAYYQENSGVAAARNKLLSYAKGEYILFVDSDDWIELNTLQSLYSLAVESDADIIGFQMVVNDATIRESLNCPIKWSRIDAIERFLYHRDFRGSLWNKLIRSSLFQGESFDVNISYGEDALMCWNILSKVNEVLICNHQFYHYRMNETSISHQNFGSQKMSAVKVWTIIVEQVQEKYPQFEAIAKGHFVFTCAVLLRNAAHCDYKGMEHIIMLQHIIRRYYKYVWKAGITTLRWRIYALLASYNYKIASII